MKEGPDIATLGALLGDPARANMLTALLRAPALTAGELAREGGVTPQTASGHLNRLLDGGVLRVLQSGRHRYYALAGPEVASLLEQMLGLASQLGHLRKRPGPTEPAMRRARVCYDHLAGEIAVELFARLVQIGGLQEEGVALALTPVGQQTLAGFGLALGPVKSGGRPLCRACMDWSERRAHLAGSSGAALFDRLVHLDWVRRVANSRALVVTRAGEANLPTLFRSPR